MIDAGLARRLKDAGLEWRPARHDNFMIPGGELASEVFSLNDQTILIENIKNRTTVTFHGSAEWALDDVLLADVVWLPTETQLRDAIQMRLSGSTAAIELLWNADGYRCTIVHHDSEYEFIADSGPNAYGRALLFLLQREEQTRGGRWVNTA